MLVSLSCMCLPYGFVGLWAVAVLNVLAGAAGFCVAVDHYGRNIQCQ
jgi:hypothetical protein